MSTTKPARERTFWVWILVAIAVFAGINALLDAARYMGWLPIATLGDLTFALPSASWLGAILSGVVGLIWFWVAMQLYNLNPQGWLFVVVMAVLTLIMAFLGWIGSGTFQSVLPALLLGGLGLIIGLLPSTKAAFGMQ